MAFEITERDPFIIVKMPTRVDVTNTQDLLDAVRGRITSQGCRFLLDLGDTEAIDSTALGAIVSLYKSLRVGEGDLMLIGTQGAVQRVLELTRLDRVFQRYDDIDGAVAAA